MMLTTHVRIMAVAWVCLTCGTGLAQDATRETTFQPYVGEVTGDDVYVRSGPSTNHYVITKYQAGDRVIVVAAERGWLAIIPPEGTFSIIAKEYVDRDRDPSVGIVNANRVNVRAAAETTQDPYVTQTQLNRGTEVRVLGDHNDRYYRIAPPEDAVLWMSEEYVVRVPGAAVPDVKAHAAPPPVTPAVRTTTTQPVVAAAKPEDEITSSVQPIRVSAPPIESGDYEKAIQHDRAELERIETALNNEMQKPLFDRDLTPLVEQFRKLRNRTSDDYTRYYAEARIDQLEDLADTILSVRRAYEVQGGVAAERDRYAAERENIKTVRIPAQQEPVAKGELRASAVYTASVGPHRYRLVDPDADATRTICYVDIPRDSDIDIAKFLGRRVGVIARTKHLRTDSIDPVPIIEAVDLILLDEAERAERADTESAPATEEPQE